MLFSKHSTKDNVLVTEDLNVKLNLIMKSNIKSNAKCKDEHYIIWNKKQMKREYP